MCVGSRMTSSICWMCVSSRMALSILWMCVGHSRRHIIWRVTVYSCAQDKLISSRRCFLLFLFLVSGRSHVIAMRMSHNDGCRKQTWRERPSNMISRRDIVTHDARR
jgi:hypothetical protein